MEIRQDTNGVHHLVLSVLAGRAGWPGWACRWITRSATEDATVNTAENIPAVISPAACPDIGKLVKVREEPGEAPVRYDNGQDELTDGDEGEDDSKYCCDKCRHSVLLYVRVDVQVFTVDNAALRAAFPEKVKINSFFAFYCRYVLNKTEPLLITH